jgi:predicted AAA+ superfamily ATPase
MFGAVLVTGARQVGKTTLLQTLLQTLLRDVAKNARYVTLDDRFQLASATTQSVTFFKDNPSPVFVDEAQYAPQLFPQIKIIVDRDRKKSSSSCLALNSSR